MPSFLLLKKTNNTAYSFIPFLWPYINIFIKVLALFYANELFTHAHKPTAHSPTHIITSSIQNMSLVVCVSSTLDFSWFLLGVTDAMTGSTVNTVFEPLT